MCNKFSHIKIVGFIFVMVFFCALSIFFSIRATHAQQRDVMADGAANIIKDVVVQKEKAFIQSPIADERSANDLGWACLATAVLADVGQEGASDKLKLLANRLFNGVIRDSIGQPIGWAGGTSKSSIGHSERLIQANKDTSIVYGFQTGLAVACLAKSGRILQKDEYLHTANDVLSFWARWRKKITPCAQCEYFFASTAPKDVDRYVRNMNLFMAFGAEELGIALNNMHLRTLARKAVQSDITERALGNKGYLGMQDPLWERSVYERERIENHSATMAVLLKSMGHSMRDEQVTAHAQQVWYDWATCSNERCTQAGCKYWAGDAKLCQVTVTASHCAFRDNKQPLANTQCNVYMRDSKYLNGFALWAWFIGNAKN